MELLDISDEEIEDFCRDFNCELAIFRLNDIEKNEFYLKMYHLYEGTSPEFIVTKKYCRGIAGYKGYDLSVEWKMFLKQLEDKKNIEKKHKENESINTL